MMFGAEMKNQEAASLLLCEIGRFSFLLQVVGGCKGY